MRNIGEKGGKIIDLTGILEKKKVLSHLMEGVPVNIDENNAQDFKFLLREYFEKDYSYEVSYDIIVDVMLIFSPDSYHVCSFVFKDSKVTIHLPPNYAGSKKELSGIGRCYRLLAAFCGSWNKITKEE